MAQVTYNGQSLAIDGRRIWVLGAAMQYTRIPASIWRDRIAAAREAGFNTIETACPWLVHEPRKGRYRFDGDADVRRFIELCAEQGMYVLLRAGPYIGSQFDGGGLPVWLSEAPGLRVREANEPFLERATRYLRKLMSGLVDLQATKDGPILLVQSEHGWRCSNPEQAEKYLLAIVRIIRECGFDVPILNANDLWQETPGTIDTWTGWTDLLVHLRQLRTVQPDAPRLVGAFDASVIGTWGRSPDAGQSADATMLHMAQVLAAGAQPVYRPFHGGTNFGFLGGRLPGAPDAFVTAAPAPGAPLGEAGARRDGYRFLKRIITFANHFGHVFADLDSDYHPITMDLPANGAGKGRGKADIPGFSIVPLRGNAGRVVFVFSRRGAKQTMLVLDDGLRMPVHLGDQPVGWFVFDVDLAGSGRLDYANLCPHAIINRSIVVLQGPAKAEACLSVNGTPLQTTVPSGKKPDVISHKGITFVICNQEQIDVTYHDDDTVYVGVSGFDADGAPRPAEGYAKPWMIDRADGIRPMTTAATAPVSTSRSRRSMKIGDWTTAPAAEYASGSSPRFASLEGPNTLAACGAPSGYGWYRVTLKCASARKRLCLWPNAGDRVHLYVNDALERSIGVGPGTKPGPFELKLGKGEHTLVAFADNLGRFADGNDLDRQAGLGGDLFEVKPMRACKARKITATPVDPFQLRSYISGSAVGQLSDTTQAIWTFTHAKKTPILFDVVGAPSSGTFVLNDHPIAYYAGATGGCGMALVLDPRTVEAFKRGKNELRFAPDARQADAIKEISAATSVYECVESITGGGTWAFAKWEPPAAAKFKAISPAKQKTARGTPCWWRSSFLMPDQNEPTWLNVAGLSKGQVLVNDHNLGRYFTATATGRAVGPQTWLYLPPDMLHEDAPNDLLIFDEHGFDPSQVAVMFRERGQFD